MLGKILLITGVVLFFLGVVISFFPGVFRWFGALPGDLSVKGENYAIYFPITTMIVVSVALSLIVNFLKR